MKNKTRSFCIPWKNFFPSSVVVSIFIISAPFNSWRIMEAVTIGPMPREIMLPKSVPRIIARYSNLESAFSERPNKGMFARTKKAPRIIRVHFNFVLNPTFFSSGFLTSGIKPKMLLKSAILYYYVARRIYFNTDKT